MSASDLSKQDVNYYKAIVVACEVWPEVAPCFDIEVRRMGYGEYTAFLVQCSFNNQGIAMPPSPASTVPTVTPATAATAFSEDANLFNAGGRSIRYKSPPCYSQSEALQEVEKFGKRMKKVREWILELDEASFEMKMTPPVKLNPLRSVWANKRKRNLEDAWGEVEHGYNLRKRRNPD